MQVLSKGNRYSPEFKAEVSLESFQRDTTIEAVRESYGVSKSVINKWHKVDDTLGHKKLAKLLGVSKHKVRRVMKKYKVCQLGQ